MYAGSKCSCFFAELVNALVMVHPLYFVLFPDFRTMLSSPIQNPQFVVYPLCVVVVGCQAERSEIEIWDFKWKLLSCFYFQ